jgi:mandelamide amidase
LSRRDFVLGAAAATLCAARGSAAASAGPAAAGPPAAGSPAAGSPVRVSPPGVNALTNLSAADAVHGMAHGDFTVESYADALLARCATHEALNAFITLDPAHVKEQARACDRARRAGAMPGPLFGLPIPIKDSVNTREYPTTGGTPALRGFRPAADAPVVAALKRSGALVLGKTNLHELSYGWTSNNHAFGAVHNPYDLKRIPGGSSGGTAAAIAARLAPLGVAEDTEGSIRVPAAFCGIAGFRPSTGRYSTRACVPISPLFDQVGPHARSVGDLALFDSAVTNDWAPLRAAPLQGVRLGIVRDYWYTDLDPEVARITELALSRLRAAGAVIVEGILPGLATLIAATTDQIQNHDVRFALADYLEEYGTGLTLEQLVVQASPDIRETFQSDVLPGGANVVSEAAYAAARDQHLPALRRLYQHYFAQNQVAAIVFPATMVPPPLIGAESTVPTTDGRNLPFDVAVARNIAPGSTAGLPGLVLPAGMTRDGLPVALEFDGPVAGDRALLALGVSLESVLGPISPPKEI